MRLLKSLAIISLSTLISLSAQAETNKNQPAKQQKAAKSQQTAKPKQMNKPNQSAKSLQNSKAAQPKPQALTNEQQLERFTNSISLKFNGIEMSEQNNQRVIHFRYTLQNISKKSISSVEWAAIYIYQNTPILIQDVPVNLKRLQPKKQQNLVFTLPFTSLSPLAQQVFSNPRNQIGIQFQAKSISFTDKSKIVVN